MILSAMLIGRCSVFASNLSTHPDTIPYPNYQNITLGIRIENTVLDCDSIDTVGNVVYYWFYDQNRWFAKVYRYYDKNLTQLQAKYLAHMAVGPDKDLIAIYLGNFYDYSKSGQLLAVIRFDEGQRHGPVFYFDRHGTLRQQGHYHKELKGGLWKYYSKSGKLKYQVEYQIPPSTNESEGDSNDKRKNHDRRRFI